MDNTTVSEDDFDESILDQPLISNDDISGSTTDDNAKDDGTETTEEKTTEESGEAKDTEATETEEQSQESKPDEREQQRLRAQMEYQQRQRARQEVEKQIDQTYGAKTEEELIAEGMSEQQAQIEALRQEMAYSQQRTQIAELNAGMQAEAVNVTNDFPVFNPKSKDFDPEFTAMVETTYKTAARLQVDDKGIILNAEVPLYDYYQQMANIYGRGTARGETQGQQTAMQMLSRTENAGGSSSVNKSTDDFDDLEARLQDVRLT